MSICAQWRVVPRLNPYKGLKKYLLAKLISLNIIKINYISLHIGPKVNTTLSGYRSNAHLL